MLNNTTAKIKLAALIGVIVIAALILERTYLTAKSPSSVKLMIYKIELMTDAADTSPQIVFSDPKGREIDLTNDIIIGQAEMRPGTYKRIRLTAANGIKVSVGNADDDPCGKGSKFTDRIVTAAGSGTDPNLRVQVGFATHDDGGGTWEDQKVTHILLGPAVIGENRKTPMEVRFTTGNSLFCIKEAVDVRAPWAGWITLSSGTAS
jgi:hypothetical protein